MRSRLALLVLLVACSSPAAKPVAAVPSPPPDAAVATADDLDVPEPTAPIVECSFQRFVHCHSGLPCKKTWPAQETGSLYPNEHGELSPSETGAARATDPTACCYVEYVTHACD